MKRRPPTQWDRTLAVVALVAIVCATSSTEPNSIVGDPVIQCGADYIALHFRTKQPFKGKVFVKGHFLSPDCQVSWNSSSSSVLHSGGTIWVKHGKCGMHRLRMMNPQGVQFSNVIVVSFHPVFITKMDRAYNVKCDYVESRKSVTFNMDVSPLTVTHVTQSFPLPTCSYTIRKDELDGEILKYARVGQQVVHRWECDSTAYGMLVHSCFVEDGQGKRVLVIDENGCHTDRLLLGDPTYVEALNMAYRESNVFKFADRLAVRFLCQIRLCLKRTGGCGGMTPPSCDSPMVNSKSDNGRDTVSVRPKRHSNISNDEQSINADLMTQLLYVLDGDDSSDGLELPEKEPKDSLCLSPLAFGAVAGVMVLTMLVTVTLLLAFGFQRRRTKLQYRKKMARFPVVIDFHSQAGRGTAQVLILLKLHGEGLMAYCGYESTPVYKFIQQIREYASLTITLSIYYGLSGYSILSMSIFGNAKINVTNTNISLGTCFCFILCYEPSNLLSCIALATETTVAQKYCIIKRLQVMIGRFCVALSRRTEFDWDNFVGSSFSDLIHGSSYLHHSVRIASDNRAAASNIHFFSFPLPPLSSPEGWSLSGSSNGDVLLWNGQVTLDGHANASAQRSTESLTPYPAGEVLQRILKSFKSIGVLQTVQRVVGAWSMVFFSADDQCLWYGRDCFGRKSLLVHDELEGQKPFLLVTSLQPVDKEKCAEAACGTLRCVKIKDLTSTITRLPDCGRLLSINANFKSLDFWDDQMEWNENIFMQMFVDRNRFEVDEFICQLSKAVDSLSYEYDEGATTIASQDEVTTTASIGLLFSGGVDSLLLAAIMGRILPAGSVVDLLNTAFIRDSGEDAFLTVPDRCAGLKGYELLKKNCPQIHWNLIMVNVGKDELYDVGVQSRIRHLIAPAGTVLDSSIAGALWFASRRRGVLYESQESRHTVVISSARVLFTGSGADEMFGGYMRHRKEYRTGGMEALVRTLEEELRNLGRRTLSRDDRVISDNQADARLPFLCDQFVSFANVLPINLKMDLSLPRGVGEKLIIRAALWSLGYAEQCFLDKHAIQFGSRIAKCADVKRRGDAPAWD